MNYYTYIFKNVYNEKIITFHNFSRIDAYDVLVKNGCNPNEWICVKIY